MGERGRWGEGLALAICLVTVFVPSQPISGGSGVPEIKCYLNGVKVSSEQCVQCVWLASSVCNGCGQRAVYMQWAWSVSSVCGGRGQCVVDDGCVSLGLQVPRVARVGGLVTKAVGVLLSVSAGMVHVTGHVTSCDWSCDFM